MIFSLWKRWRRSKLKDAAAPESWKKIINEKIPYYQLLTPSDRLELLDHVKVFMAEKTFEACGGLKLSEEIKIIIATQACILLLHRKHDYYPELELILVYPHPFSSEIKHYHPSGLVSDETILRDGESWKLGTIVVAWDRVLAGASDTKDGHNVVLHEFAHQLDGEDGAVNGTPLLGEKSQYSSWAQTLSNEFYALVKSAEKHNKTVLDKYGSTNPAEFFAVATEAFFEKPKQLQKKHPELYSELKKFYRQDPASFLIK